MSKIYNIFSMHYVVLFIAYIFPVLAYMELQNLEGFEECEVIDYMVGEDARLYNCSGTNTSYQDYENKSTNSSYYEYPVNADFNKLMMGFATFDNMLTNAEANDSVILGKRTNMFMYDIQTASGVFQALLTSFIKWGSRHMSKPFKVMGSACTMEKQLISHNGEGRILRMTVQNNHINWADCDTSAQRKTIAGAIDRWVKDHSHLCGTWCMNLTHSGDWIGYISLGIGESSIQVPDCDRVFTWGAECSSVGK
mmetsp:Transcript_7685/g.7623  ORF Transcript_7685/g.7623 Transcript_7685/m.7623 type:complete len:252 (+) Transcript_7685:46-801(+)